MPLSQIVRRLFIQLYYPAHLRWTVIEDFNRRNWSVKLYLKVRRQNRIFNLNFFLRNFEISLSVIDQLASKKALQK